MKGKYKFHVDPGHGWLAVPVKELEEHNLLSKISVYSYRRGDTVFLEEDCDAPLFIEAANLNEYDWEYVNHDDMSFIRHLQPFRQTGWQRGAFTPADGLGG